MTGGWADRVRAASGTPSGPRCKVGRMLAAAQAGDPPADPHTGEAIPYDVLLAAVLDTETVSHKALESNLPGLPRGSVGVHRRGDCACPAEWQPDTRRGRGSRPRKATA